MADDAAPDTPPEDTNKASGIHKQVHNDPQPAPSQPQPAPEVPDRPQSAHTEYNPEETALPAEREVDLANQLMPEERVRLRNRFGEVEPPPIELRHQAESLEPRKWVRFSDDLKVQYLGLMAMYGNRSKCAKALGLSPSTVRKHKQKDREFAEAVEVAMEVFRDSIEEAITDRAIIGWEEPVYSQRLGCKIGTIRKFDNRLLELLAKRHIPAFREKQQLDVSVNGGVLLIPQQEEDPDKWLKDRQTDDSKPVEGLPPQELSAADKAKTIEVTVTDTESKGAPNDDDGPESG